MIYCTQIRKGKGKEKIDEIEKPRENGDGELRGTDGRVDDGMKPRDNPDRKSRITIKKTDPVFKTADESLKTKTKSETSAGGQKMTMNKKLSKREIVRRMYQRMLMGENTSLMNLTYLGRRIGKTKTEAKYFVNALNRLGFIKSVQVTPSLIKFVA